MRPFDPVRPATVWALNVNMPLAVIRRFIFVCLNEKLLGTCEIFASERFSHPVSVRKIVPAEAEESLRLAYFGKSFVDLLHDPLGPLNACRDQLVGSRAALWSSEQIVCCLHVQARQNCSHDPQHTLAAFIHPGILHSFALCSPPQPC